MCHGYANRWNPGARDAPSQSLGGPIRGQKASGVISELSRQGQTEHTKHPDRNTNQDARWSYCDQWAQSIGIA